MDSRERTFLALNFEQGDRIPMDVWMSEGCRHKLGLDAPAAWAAFLDAHDVDLRYIAGPRYIGPPLRAFPDGTDEDIWGVRRRLMVVPTIGGREHYRELAQAPLAGATSVAEVEAYGHWPSADWFDYGDIAAQCDAVRDAGRIVVFQGDRLNRIAQLKPAMYLRGIQEILEDLLLRPDLARAILARIRGFYEAYAGRIFEAAGGRLDIVLTGDDFGSQAGPLISPRLWADFLGQGFAAYAGLAHAYGVRVMHHTCGAVFPLIPMLLERGLDVLQSVQPEAAGMAPAGLKAAFGDWLAFQGGISIQGALPFGRPADVRAEVEARARVLGAGGGYIFGTAHNIQADAPAENVAALLQAYRDFGRYD